MNSKYNKQEWSDATGKISIEKWEQLKKVEITPQVCKEHWQTSGVEMRNAQEVDDYGATPGKWFYTPLQVPCGTKENPFNKNMSDPQLAYHGCSLDAAVEILRNKVIKIGPNCHEDKIGVYCERQARKGSCYMYASNSTPIPETGLLSACIFELQVDRAVGMTVNRQWVQPENSIVITGIYTHLQFHKVV